MQLKGRVACEVNTSDELILTEVVFENVLEPLTPAEAAATLSAFIFQAKTGDEPTLTPGLVTARDHILQVRALTCSSVEPFTPSLSFLFRRLPSSFLVSSRFPLSPPVAPSLPFLSVVPGMSLAWFFLRCRVWLTLSFSRSLIILSPFPCLLLLILSCPLLLVFALALFHSPFVSMHIQIYGMGGVPQITTSLALLQREHGLDVSAETLCKETLNFGLMEVRFDASTVYTIQCSR